MLELNEQINLMTGIQQGSAYIWTSSFAFLFFGHIVDNVRDVKWLFIVLEISSSLWFVIMGAVFLHDGANGTDYGRTTFPFSFLLISGMQIIQIIQLFNWFSKRRLNTVIGLWLLVQQAGQLVRFEIDNICPLLNFAYFPYISNFFDTAAGYEFIVVGALFFMLAIFDSYSWVYHPFQRNILIDVTDKSEAEQMQLKALTHNDSLLGNSSLNLGESVINIYDMIQASVNSKQGNSFIRAFEVSAVLKLLLCGVVFQTAVYMIYFLDMTEFITETQTPPYTQASYFIAGANVAYLTVGPISDFLLKGRAPFFVLSLLIALEILNAAFLVFGSEDKPSEFVRVCNACDCTINATAWDIVGYAILGYLQTYIHILLLITIPLVIAAQYRDEVDFH